MPQWPSVLFQNPKISPVSSAPANSLPSREQLLETLAQDIDIKGKRDLAKVFGIRGDMRRPFKAAKISVTCC